MKHATHYRLLLAAGLTFGTLHPAAAQGETKVYTYVEQMPQLPGSAGVGAVQAAILKNIRYPADAVRDKVEGRVFLAFVVTEKGEVTDLRIVKGLSASLDAAVLAAARQLPRFEPGQQNGRAVSVSQTIPLTLTPGGPPIVATTVKGNTPSAAELAAQNKPAQEMVEDKVYTYVEQMPTLPGGGGQQAIVEAVQQRLVLPADAQEGRIFAKFVVRTDGSVADVAIVKGVSVSLDEAVLAAIRKLPRLVAGKQNGRAVAVSFTIPVTVFLPNHVFEARDVTTRARFPGLFTYLQRNLHVPAIVTSEKMQGVVGVDFVVLASGKIDSPALTSHLCSSCDEEVLRLVKSLPAWVPARRSGQAVAVHQHLDVPLPLPSPSAPYTRPAEFPTYVSQPATLLDGASGTTLDVALAQAMRYPEAVRREKITGTVQLEFVVDTHGIVREPRITQSVCSSCDQAVLDALASLGPFLPARQSDQPIATKLRVSVPVNPAQTAQPVK